MIWASDFFEHAALDSVLNHLHRGQVAKWLFSYLAVYFVKQTVWALIWRVNTQRTKMLLKLVTNENEWWSLKSMKWCFTRWNCHIWQLVWLLFLQQCHVNTKYQSWCFYNIAYIQPNAPPVCHCLDKSSHKLGIGWAYVAMLDLNISVRPLCSLRLQLFDQNTVKKNSNIDLLSFIYTQWLWKKA